MSAEDTLQVFAQTDVGQKREHNEDNYLVDRELGFFVVCDGMGGHAAGEVASALAARTVHDQVRKRWSVVNEALARRQEADVPSAEVLDLLRLAVQTASAKVYAAGQQDRSKRGMGTTLSALLVLESHAYIAHVGDSRIYLMRGGQAKQLTRDHGLRDELERMGIVSDDSLAQVTNDNILSRAVGVYTHVEVDTVAVEILPHDEFLLTTDGLTAYVENPELYLKVLATAADGVEGVQALVDYANELGGKDNITAVYVRVSAGDPADEYRARRLALKRKVLAAMPLFRKLDDRELLRILQIAKVTTWGAAQTIVSEGQPGDELTVVLSGRVQVSRGQTVLREMGPGEQFGEMALVRQRHRSATVTAVDECELVTIHRDDFAGLLRAEPYLAAKLLWEYVSFLSDWLDESSAELSRVWEFVQTDAIAYVKSK